MNKYVILIFIGLFFLSLNIFAQRNPIHLEIQHADAINFDNNNYRLIGNVSLRQDKILVNSDSAYLAKGSSNLKAYGRVCIKQGDSVTLKGKYLLYRSDQLLAHVTGKVILKNPKMLLTTSTLDYNLKNDIAEFKDSAKITSDDNELTSRHGYYNSRTHDIFFNDNVTLKNPSYIVKTDSLQYNTYSKKSIFKGATFINIKDNIIYCESGWYKTSNKTALFTDHPYLKTQTKKLQADTLKYDQVNKTGICVNNVKIIDSVNRFNLTGDYAEYHEARDSSFITGHATMMQINGLDSLFLTGDTIKTIKTETRITDPKSEYLIKYLKKLEGSDVPKSIKDKSGDYFEALKKNPMFQKMLSQKIAAATLNFLPQPIRFLYAFNSVKIYTNKWQGKCDSLKYIYRDSVIKMFSRPVLWLGSNQLTADTIIIYVANNCMSKILLNTNAFFTMKVDSSEIGSIESQKFNQVNGSKIQIDLKDNKIDKLTLIGLGQSVFYSKKNEENSFLTHQQQSSNFEIRINENEFDLMKNNSGEIKPFIETTEKKVRLNGFNWREKERFKSVNDLFKN